FEWLKKADIVFASECMKSKIKQFKTQALKNGFKELKSTSSGWLKFKNKKKTVYYFLGDAVEAAAMIKLMRVKIDVVDLDTCGSTIPTIPIFLALLKPKHIVITHGEFHSLRFKRDDVLRRLFFHQSITE